MQRLPLLLLLLLLLDQAAAAAARPNSGWWLFGSCQCSTWAGQWRGWHWCLLLPQIWLRGP
jgi:hypothetical protein